MQRTTTIKGFDVPCPACGRVDSLLVWLHATEVIHCVYCKAAFLPDQLPRRKPYRALRAWLLASPHLTLEE